MKWDCCDLTASRPKAGWKGALSVAPNQDRMLESVWTETTAAPPCVFVLFGATGDLAARKIAPALYNLYREGLLNERIAVLGVARRPRSDEQFRDEMLEALKTHSRSQPIDMDVWSRFAPRWHYHITHIDEPAEYRTLAARLDEIDQAHGTGGSRLFYLALSPTAFSEVAGQLAAAGLNRPAREDGFVRLVVEKPFGRDLASARQLNRSLLAGFDESQIYRIDHYLGKETVQNILVFRFANAIFEELFSRKYVQQVQITVAESVGMEGRRGPYYETVGAMRDMMQNHVLQLLSLVAMEVPSRMDSQSIRDEKVKVLKCIRPLTPEQAATQTVRGQYLGDDDGPSYRTESGVDASSQVETYAGMRLAINNWRWSGVPFYLRTGKRLARKVTNVVFVFKREPLSLFDNLACDLRGANQLIIRVAPDEGISLVFDAKVPGVKMLFRPVRMDFHYETSFESATPEAYEHLVLDAVGGDATLFIRSDEVEESWRLVDSIRSAWDVSGRPELQMYAPGSWGPDAAQLLLEDPYQRWILD